MVLAQKVLLRSSSISVSRRLARWATVFTGCYESGVRVNALVDGHGAQQAKLGFGFGAIMAGADGAHRWHKVRAL
jgi:hypothetical protein